MVCFGNKNYNILKKTSKYSMTIWTGIGKKLLQIDKKKSQRVL